MCILKLQAYIHMYTQIRMCISTHYTTGHVYVFMLHTVYIPVTMYTAGVDIQWFL